MTTDNECYCKKITDTELLDKPTAKQLYENEMARCLYYRYLYGGMAWDLRLLLHACNEILLDTTTISIISDTNTPLPKYEKEIDNDIHILLEAVDFHCYPEILYKLQKENKYTVTEMREYIWATESAPNLRKPETLDAPKHVIIGLNRLRNEYIDSLEPFMV